MIQTREESGRARETQREGGGRERGKQLEEEKTRRKEILPSFDFAILWPLKSLNETHSVV